MRRRHVGRPSSESSLRTRSARPESPSSPNKTPFNHAKERPMKERQEAIKRYIERKGDVTLSELAKEFSDWSEMTIRRDLEFLEVPTLLKARSVSSAVVGQA